jgi:hypothetical protein
VGSSGEATRFGYFVVQAKAGNGSHDGGFSGVLENLGTGEKQVFQSSDGLVRLLEEWSRQRLPQRT